MKDQDAGNFLNHSRQLYLLAERLSENGIAVYEHSYDMLSFGSWVLTAGTRKCRFRFIWDGKDNNLRIEKASIPDSGTILKWEAISEGIQQSNEDKYKEIGTFIKRQFEAQQENRRVK